MLEASDIVPMEVLLLHASVQAEIRVKNLHNA
jgi:hypothetical protein